MFIPTPGAVIAERYALIEEIGRGGMGAVWRAEHKVLGAACAIKFMHEVANEQSYRQRFLNEARAAAQIQSPHVARVFDVDEWHGRPYIAMEFLEGETLDAMVERVGALSPALTCEIIDQMARGLARAHAARLIHRDLKPSNVFLVRQEPGEPVLVKLLDFGLVKRLDREGPNATQSGMLLGTPGYMSPEQALGSRAVDERTDLWSLAAIAFYCLTGNKPFPGEALAQVLLQVIHGELPVPSQVNPNLAPTFDSWWQRAAHRDAAQRPSSALHLASELRTALRLPAPPSLALDEATTLALADTTVVTAVRAQPRPDTLQPASRPRARPRNGFPVLASVAALAILIVGSGLISALRRQRAASDEPGATIAGAAAITPASSEPGVVPDASVAVPRREAKEESDRASLPPPSVDAARDAGAAPAPARVPPARARAAETGSGRTHESGPRAKPARFPTSKPPRVDVSPAREQRPRQPKAPERPMEKKNDRLGF